MPKSVTDQAVNVIDRLRREHAQMDERVHELERRHVLSPSEQVERLELKKRKLLAKDQIALLERDLS